MSVSSNSNRFRFARAESLPTNWVAANLAQPREGGQHMYLALVQALLGHRLHHLLAAAAQFGQVKLALLVAKLAVAALLDALGQIFGHVLLEAAQQQRAQLGRQPAPGMRCAGSAASPPGRRSP
jgi:hypothetical protein